MWVQTVEEDHLGDGGTEYIQERCTKGRGLGQGEEETSGLTTPLWDFPKGVRHQSYRYKEMLSIYIALTPHFLWENNPRMWATAEKPLSPCLIQSSPLGASHTCTFYSVPSPKCIS